MSAKEVHLNSRKVRRIRPVDFYGLVAAALQAAANPKIGFEHVSKTQAEFFQNLETGYITISYRELESLLYSANMLSEREAFIHPLGLTFDETLGKVLFPKEKFNKDLNIIELRRKL